MGVNSLWKVLEEAECGRAVGAEDLVNPNLHLTNPFNINDKSTIKRQTLAIDLSIWICEALTQPKLAESNAQPVIHLVYTRTLKLLHLGIKLIGVIEGKRRVMSTNEEDKFHKRRSGNKFWKACKACEELLGIMGVPVVKAKAEGEALCALLNQRGIVDGVISNDGDCLLFGAKVVYTRFNMANLNDGQVIRYDASHLKAIANSTDKETEGQALEGTAQKHIKFDLSREDLVAFALLTGSDLAGNGFDKVGHRKAVRFIFKSKQDNPFTPDTAATDELKSWARAAKVNVCTSTTESSTKRSCCTICCHGGNKKSHLKHGCDACGTGPGEPCLEFSRGDRFRKSLRKKAMAANPRFAPSQTVDSYMRPNDNQLPLVLMNTSSQKLRMKTPRLQDMMKSSFIVKGLNLQSSCAYVMETFGRLLARRDLFDDNEDPERISRMSLSGERPIPIKITKECVRNGQKCFEITWCVTGTMTDPEGNDIDGFEFNSMESQSMFRKYADIIEAFQESKKALAKQGDAMNRKRTAFKSSLLGKGTTPVNDGMEFAEKEKKRPRKSQKPKRQTTFFEKRSLNQCHDGRPMQRTPQGQGDDVGYLMLAIGNHETQAVILPRVKKAQTTIIDSAADEAIDEISCDSMSTISLVSKGELKQGVCIIKGVKTARVPAEGYLVVTNMTINEQRPSTPMHMIDGQINYLKNPYDVDDLKTIVSTIFDEFRGVVLFKRQTQPSQQFLVSLPEPALSDGHMRDNKSVVSHLRDEFHFDRNWKISTKTQKDPCCNYFSHEMLSFVPPTSSKPIASTEYEFPPTPVQVYEHFQCDGSRNMIKFFSPPQAYIQAPSYHPYLTPFPDKSTRPRLTGQNQVLVDMGIQIKVSPLVGPCRLKIQNL